MKVRGKPARSIAILLTLAMLITGMGIVPAFAAGAFDGGAEAPLYVLNDHTVVGVRVSAPIGALEASTTYYLKMRFTVDTAPSSATNRGFTWNPTAETWIQEREAWTNFPVVTTEADGSLKSTWVYVKFGDEATSGDYYLTTSLSLTGSGSTFNGTVQPVVHVIDAETEGAWVHNGNATGVNNKRAELLSQETTPVVLALTQTEANGVDEDANLTTDDEDSGPVGISGDYRMGIDAGTTFALYLNRSKISSDLVNPVADTDLALMAGDGVAPSAPASVVATTGSGQVTLSWVASADVGSGVARYDVYRWVDDPLTTLPYTQVRELAGSTTGTSFVDTGLLNGTEYSYLVRAVDGDTNVSARSATVLATPVGDGDLDRLSGDTRYTTAIDISASTFAGSSVTTAVIATGKNFPDALAASGLAGVYDCPVLLVSDSVTASLTAELDRLGATGVVLIGETPAISADVAAQLALDYNVQRIGGANRFETAVKVAEEIEALTGSVDSAFIVRGDTFPDALATAPFAFSQQWPVLLVRTDGVPTETSDAITNLGIDNAVIAGSESAVNAATFTALDGMLSGLLERVWGDNRYETAAEIAEYGAAEGWGDFGYVGMATGLNFPDALGGGVAAGHNGGVLLLTPSTSLHEAPELSITTHKDEIDLVELYGSAVALSDAVRDTIDAILNP